MRRTILGLVLGAGLAAASTLPALAESGCAWSKQHTAQSSQSSEYIPQQTAQAEGAKRFAKHRERGDIDGRRQYLSPGWYH